VADYTGSRRADAAPACPQCGALVRPEQSWCSRCLHVVNAPEPEPEPEPLPEPGPVPLAEPLSGSGPAPTAASGTLLAPEVEAAADALLEQLARQTQSEGLHLPSYLQTKGQRAVAVAVAMSVLSGGVLLLMTVLGAFLH
jgi:hypothetical protein